ncbi:short-chain dehydrogenase [Ureibacillus thermophilus]|uniref:Short-chain dehydrogenase n=1 Tax=Ureibacillus thermophilus TaxID=367743 RepID=A0A4P6US50_9BACL|nr:short-chain dehydrogenase [Ureibacillus thermophilus]QBK25467.1 short-chain dehydrogenase [Ureibacillus thermophilus]
MNNVWTVLTIFVSIILIAISYVTTVSVMKKTEQRASTTDVPISRLVREHPILMNPIILMYVVFLLFLGILIFYLWAKYGY